MFYELKSRGINVTRQQIFPVKWKSLQFDKAFPADLIAEDRVIIELKSVEHTTAVHKKQLLTYLRLTDKRLGLLINFGSALIRDGIFRVVNGLNE